MRMPDSRSEGSSGPRVDGAMADEQRHVMLLAIPTLGLPAAVKALTWEDDIIGDQ